ncbi:TPA: helix-turn-helix domain-containing protein [Yersinia enterocolitica]|uniref:helix-turn-helix domain-containing protein n=1 Tax=Yersinia TaxID=629 RepID=UPI001D12A910|nr:XRE family transcriptional regulator [Yersinia proxima]EKN3726406.1 ImmA/IrrE family metallo-endopeptidase [Yersinia enterocolitica]EKN4811016.1 ImmA/IrrE family metallo-endopeptidase [Yersinia enterocolitica]HDL7329050.1 ImmA/IrrE family metallo-endopeptidase [Yersinia enterocolitica]HDL7354483.1 ImmA/IrrE family metallo-endopeptidase [Yersinia enterocolitica]HDL7957305.1 ImmA/IrrE family metallo-endopeptidase [Yersinia enterocolitica]
MFSQFVGDRLRLARLLKGFTLQEVGDAVFVSRQNIHQFESGARKPSDDVLEALSEFLEVKTSFFFLPLETEVKAEQCHFRKRKTTPVNVTNRILAFGTIFEQLVYELHQQLELPSPNFDILEHYDFDSNELDASMIELIAEKTRCYWGLGIDAPIESMTRVLENAGAIVVFIDDPSDKVDALSMNRKYPLVVRNTAKDNACRLRFDLAHECGHLILHQGIETGDAKTEKEADMFASAFLFPRSSFVKEFKKCMVGSKPNIRKIIELTLKWKVSAKMIIYRARFLDLISAIDYRSLNVYLNNKGYTKKEPYGDLIIDSEPEVLKDAIDVLKSDLGISSYMLADKLGLTPETFSIFAPFNCNDSDNNNVVVPIRF